MEAPLPESIEILLLRLADTKKTFGTITDKYRLGIIPDFSNTVSEEARAQVMAFVSSVQYFTDKDIELLTYIVKRGVSSNPELLPPTGYKVVEFAMCCKRMTEQATNLLIKLQAQDAVESMANTWLNAIEAHGVDGAKNYIAQKWEGFPMSAETRIIMNKAYLKAKQQWDKKKQPAAH